MRACLVIAVAVTLGLLDAGDAHAFQDPMRFASSPMEAGGGGRYFTGSPVDGFTCTVCHKGYDVPLKILGLPAGNYVPGRTYRILVDWPDGPHPVGLNAEITNRQGQTAGQLVTPPPDQLTPADLCTPVELGMPNAGVLPVPGPYGDRQVGVVFACGAKQATFEWQAPSLEMGPVWFTGSLVVSDELGSLDGDGVVDFAHVVGSPRAPDPMAAEITSGCSVHRAPSGAPRGVPLSACCAALAGLVLGGRRRPRRR